MVTSIESEYSPTAVLERLRGAIGRHDLAAMAACFDADYHSEFPVHPDRTFRGPEQMRKNWTQVFGAVPDIEAELLRCTSEGDTVWAEWEWRGTRADGAPFAMRGTTIQGVKHARNLLLCPTQHNGYSTSVLSCHVGGRTAHYGGSAIHSRIALG